MHLVEYFSFAIGTFLAIHFCFLPEGNRKANVLLGLVFLELSIGIVYFEELGWLDPEMIYFLQSLDTIFLYATLLLFYLFSVTNTSSSYSQKFRWLFIPAVVFSLIRFAFPFVPMSERQALLVEKGLGLIDILSMGFGIAVLLIALKHISFHRKNIHELYSNTDRKHLNWLQALMLVNIGFFSIWIIDDGLIWLIGDNELSYIIANVSLYATLFNILWLGFSALRQPRIFGEETQFDPQEMQPEVSLSDTDQTLFNEISERIQREQIYLNPSLSLKELALALEIRDKELSRLINACSDGNFYHFINAFRIEHFKKLYRSQGSETMSIFGLAMESGFNSKSTFYGAFRKIEGMTPKQFEERLKLTKETKTSPIS